MLVYILILLELIKEEFVQLKMENLLVIQLLFIQKKDMDLLKGDILKQILIMTHQILIATQLIVMIKVIKMAFVCSQSAEVLFSNLTHPKLNLNYLGIMKLS